MLVCMGLSYVGYLVSNISIERLIFLLYSYFLYSISHPNKHGEPLIDLSADSKAHVDDAENLSHGLLKVERVIQSVWCELPITEKIRATFKSKLWRMHGQRISKIGSVKRKELLENWKCGRDSEWQVQWDAVMMNKALVKANQE